MAFAENNMQPFLGLNYAISLQGVFPSRNLTDGEPNSGNLSANPLIGGVGLFAGNFAPRGWAFAEGQVLQISQHTALFSILGTTYGGDGRSTFALPDLRGRTAIGARRGPGLSNVRLGEKTGEREVSLTIPQMPRHTHPLPGGSLTTDATGGNQSHENTAPSLGLNYVVALVGTFPSRNLTGDEGDEPGSGNLADDPLLGSISLFAGTFAPRGWAFADGQLLLISENEALFSIFSDTYGGDGRTTFALPDMRGRAALHEGSGPGLTPRSLGSSFGDENVTLSNLNLASHTHPVLYSADLNADTFVDSLDLGILLSNFNTNALPSGGELNCINPVDSLDLGILLDKLESTATGCCIGTRAIVTLDECFGHSGTVEATESVGRLLR